MLPWLTYYLRCFPCFFFRLWDVVSSPMSTKRRSVITSLISLTAKEVKCNSRNANNKQCCLNLLTCLLFASVDWHVSSRLFLHSWFPERLLLILMFLVQQPFNLTRQSSRTSSVMWVHTESEALVSVNLGFVVFAFLSRMFLLVYKRTVRLIQLLLILVSLEVL